MGPASARDELPGDGRFVLGAASQSEAGGATFAASVATAWPHKRWSGRAATGVESRASDSFDLCTQLRTASMDRWRCASTSQLDSSWRQALCSVPSAWIIDSKG